MASTNNDSSSPSRGLTNWIWNSKSTKDVAMKNNDAASVSQESEEAKHRKKLAQILRYIATMHHSLGGGENKRSGHSFVRKSQNQPRLWQSSFYQGLDRSSAGEEEPWGVLLSTSSFRRLLSIQAESSTALFDSPPFSFYAANSGSQSSSPSNRKRGWADTFRTSPSSNNQRDGKSCWLRLTRLTSSEMPEPPSLSNPAVRRYLQQWRDQNANEFRYCNSLRDILTLQTLERAPKIAPADFSRAREIKSFLKNYKTYLRKKAFQQALEPMYNQLFEWVQQTQHSDELVWGLGHARMITGESVVNGPLLEVLMEVELARDGALLVRPREHTGVALNREVINALTLADDNSSVTSGTSASTVHQRLAELHRSVAELDPLQLAPGQPTTYIPFLKRIVVELSSGGSFQMSVKASDQPPEPFKMLVTEAWCLYSRPKPSSVWARDAMAFADQLLLAPTGTNSLDLPKAARALTLGPSALDEVAGTARADTTENSSKSDGLVSRLLKGTFYHSSKAELATRESEEDSTPIVFPLPTSDSQNRIAHLLLKRQYPAIVTEGPPGTGKTHTIVNMISAYLCSGKRVLVTSKAAPALSVIRERLPKCVQDLCVDVSMSELAGMRQLQQTVERLANRVSCASTELEREKCSMLLRNIAALERERADIDEKLASASDRVRNMLQHPNGQKLVLGMIELNEQVPWLMKSVAPWSLERLTEFRNETSELIAKQDESMGHVHLGSTEPATPELVSLVAAKAGAKLASAKQATKKALASVPLLGYAFSVSEEEANALQEKFDAITFDGRKPESETEWQQVLEVLRFEEAIAGFHKLVEKEGWPEVKVFDRIGEQKQQRLVRIGFLETLEEALRMKELSLSLDVAGQIEFACECSVLDARRGIIASQIQRMAEDLVDARVVTELSRSFSAEAQSALIRFSQIAGKARFSRSSQPSKMTARQRRHRQEYLDAFDRCVRYIPAWIMTSSQISDYLPSECLFDLVVIDEASQSDATVIPLMLRAKQWLIVGDGKQVSPTESFISEDSIDSLRAALPRCPFEDGLLPGQSFFDLCAQAYPKGRVVLSEHFRCAPEIINFSNHQFYDGRLVPLRLPTSSERLSPSLLDVRVADGIKVGKVNERECDEIVRLVELFALDAASQCMSTPRTIGIISLLGDDQSRLIRGRLLDRIGPSKFKEHQVLVGDPPTFQGAERDIVFLSMVCSPGSVPTQNRLMHAQRVNVALSRARDRMVLVRSIDAHHVPNNEDVKLPVIEFFEAATRLSSRAQAASEQQDSTETKSLPSLCFRVRVEALLEKELKGRGFVVRKMGVVWNDALCVEHKGSNARAGLCVENVGESKEEWVRKVAQQRSIERVGWKCLRVDGLSLLANQHATMAKVLEFLASAGVEEPPLIYDSLEEEEEDLAAEGANEAQANEELAGGENIVPDVDMDRNDAVVISSDDENEEENKKISACFPDMATSDNMEAMLNDQMQPSQFGEVVQNLDFLRGRAGYSSMDESSVPDTAYVPAAPHDAGRASTRSLARRSSNPAARAPREEAYLGDLSDSGELKTEAVAAGVSALQTDTESVSSRRRRKYRRLDKYSRDARWYPGGANAKEEEKEEDGQKWYDTDSDLPSDGARDGSDEEYEPATVRS